MFQRPPARLTSALLLLLVAAAAVAPSGARGRLSVEVRGHPEYTLLGRRSYLAPKD